MSVPKPSRLQKQLTLFDVYVISTAAMFSSGFFLLPGLATAESGPSVVLAYFISGLLIVPAMVSQAELATAMPRAGGAYYFLDRTLGPLVGTMGGLSTWVALMLKSAFALIGMGAYLGLFFDVPVKPMAIAFTIVFGMLNILGAKESSKLLRVLVFGLLAILGLFLVHGMIDVTAQGFSATHQRNFTPFFESGVDGLLGTVGLVFISYVGLTQVASMAEEVKDPDRNIPLGMTLSLASVTGIYVVGVYIMVAVLGTDALSASLTPVADTAGQFSRWLPGQLGVVLVVIAAIAAFSSMSNAGIMAASRYPLAMARDGLVPPGFANLSRMNTPVRSIIVTCLVLILLLVVLDIAQVAKLASALQLLIFVMVNLAVIVMRESRIESYDPGFRSPLYPWMQVIGIVFPLFLVAEMGWLPVLFSISVMAGGIAWYQYYAKKRIARDGAIFHVFERLGRRRFAGLDRELRDIMKEKGARAADPFDEVVARAGVIDHRASVRLEAVVREASGLLSGRLPVTAEHLVEEFERGIASGGTPVGHGSALLHTRLPELDMSELVIVRCATGIEGGVGPVPSPADAAPIQALFLLVSGQNDPGRHLRILAHLAGRIEEDGFMSEWLSDPDEQDLKETLLRDERFLALEVRAGTASEGLLGRALREIDWPEGTLVALIGRRGQNLVPRGRTILREGDRLTIIGEPNGLQTLGQQYQSGHG